MIGTTLYSSGSIDLYGVKIVEFREISGKLYYICYGGNVLGPGVLLATPLVPVQGLWHPEETEIQEKHHPS